VKLETIIAFLHGIDLGVCLKGKTSGQYTPETA